MYRRSVLVGASTVLTTALAGCGGDGGDGATPAETATPTETEMSAQTETATPTETEMSAQTETATRTPTPEAASENIHEIGEEFTVGEEGNEITYRILELARADQLGGQVNFSEADGTFLIVTLEFTNPQDEPVEFPQLDFRLQSADAWQRFDTGASQKINSDERLDVEYIGDSTFTAGRSTVGAVAFDVDPDLTYRLWITPAGDATTPEHFVPLGDLSSVEELGGYT